VAELKGVVFGIDSVLVRQGHVSVEEIERIGKLVRYLDGRGIECIAVSNHEWTAGKQKTPIKKFLQGAWGVEIDVRRYGWDGKPGKQSADTLKQVVEERGWRPNQVLYVGNSETDMQSAVNGGVLFINALWFGDNCEYGIRAKSPQAVARFIDVFCIRDHWWYFAVEDGPLKVYSLAPFSTYAIRSHAKHSEDFIQTVKKALGDAASLRFWAWYLCTSVYFSGVYERINHIAPYPSHRPGQYRTVLEKPVTVFGKCFRASYLGDLIVRHKASVESKAHRGSVDHTNQLDTIHLNPMPLKPSGATYKNSPLRKDKTVLVLDDIVTCGYSLEAARHRIEQTGAKVVCVGILKALNHGYRSLKGVTYEKKRVSPYAPLRCHSVVTGKEYGYHDHIVDHEAASDLSRRLTAYRDWDWPA
jgi:hypoxanthine phosphoribosyltransferase